MISKCWKRLCAFVRGLFGLREKDQHRRMEVSRGDDPDVAWNSRKIPAASDSCPSSFLPLGAEPLSTEDSLGKPAPEEQPEISQTIGPYILVRKIGEGGGGSVYEAVHSQLRRKVALKLINKRRADSQAPDRLYREAVAVSALHHPGIVTVFDHGEAGPWYWIGMELVPGRNLAAELRLHRGSEGGDREASILPTRQDSARIPKVVELCARVADALQHAHDMGVTHRDIKPGNILLQPNGNPKVVDFGLARLQDSPNETKSGEVVGTPYYMSPEQVAGEPERIGRSTDIYSLGVVLFELLTDRLPFTGEYPWTVLHKIHSDSAPHVRSVVPTLPLDLDAVCHKAMARLPSERYGSAAEFAEDLRRFLRFEAVLAARPTPWNSTRKWVRRNRRRLTAACAAALLLSAASLAVWDYSRSQMMQEEILGIDERMQQAIASGAASTLNEIYGQLKSLKSRIGDRDRFVSARVAGLLAQCERLGNESISAGKERARLALGDPASGTPTNESALLEAVANMNSGLSMLAPDEPPEADITFWFPRLSLDSDPSHAEVYLCKATVPAGDFELPKQPVGTTPIRSLPVAPGLYRITVIAPGRQAELTRWLFAWGKEYDLKLVPLQETSTVTKGMIRVDAGSQELLLAAFEGERPLARTVPHAAFYMDPDEVTNAEYATFLAGNPEAWLKPLHWEHFSSPEYGDRPVVCLSYE